MDIAGIIEVCNSEKELSFSGAVYVSDHLRIESRSGAGTSVSFVVPLSGQVLKPGAAAKAAGSRFP